MTDQNKSLVVLGAGGHAKVVIDIAQLLACYKTISVFDDAHNAKPICGLQISGMCNQAINTASDKTEFIVAIGHNATRKKWLDQVAAAGYELATLIHPSAAISPSASIGIGSVVMAGAIVNTDSRIGEGCIVNTACSIDHDCIIEDVVHIAPGVNLCGGVTVGRQALVGVGSAILPGINIGEYSVIGGGATVCSDIPAHVIAQGTPAKYKNKSGEKSC